MATAQARSRRSGGSYDDRRDRLADSALLTLGDRGYADTSLRDIAANSEFSHGVVHYYFRDKTELITYAVRRYKQQCVTRYDDVIANSTTTDELVAGFADRLVETIVEDSSMHRLWYDLRTQAMFSSALHADVLYIDSTLEDMIWRVLEHYSMLAGRPIAVSKGIAYAMLDGIFERALLRYLTGDGAILDELRATVHATLPSVLG